MDIDPRLSGSAIPHRTSSTPSPSTTPEAPNSMPPSVEGYTTPIAPASGDTHSNHSRSTHFQNPGGLPLTFSVSTPLTPLTSTAPGPGSLLCSPVSSIVAASAGAAPAAAAGPSPHPDQKRPRACESCRSLKVRCELNEQDPAGSCRRCSKAKRECVFTAPSRKRQKKTDSKVAELERKIDALTASLNATRHTQATGTSHGDLHAEDDDQDDADGECDTPGPSDTGRGDLVSPVARHIPHTAKRRRCDDADSTDYGGFQASERVHPPANENRTPPQGETFFSMAPFLAPKGSTIPIPSYARPEEGCAHTFEYMDVIERQLLSMEMATAIFNHYNNNMAKQFPAVIFPEGTKAEDVRQKSPTLFLAILAASSGTSHPDLHRALHKEITRVFAERIVVNGEKSLELIQALLLVTIWYYPPEHFEELKFYMFIHQAAIMALDIGIGAKTGHVRSRASGMLGKGFNGKLPDLSQAEGSGCPFPPYPFPPGMRCSKNPFPDPCSIESRRTLLACYWMCCNVSVSLRRQNLLHFTNFMAECVDVLENSPEAADTDRMLCQLVRMQKIGEDIATAYAFDDASANVNIQDSRVQYTLKGFSRQLEEWRAKAADQVWNKSMEITYHVVTLFAHEVALHVDHNIDDFRPPFTESTIRSQPSLKMNLLLTPFHIEALTTCMTASHATLDTFLSSQVAEIQSCPVFNLVRTAYALVILIKLYFSASYPKSELGKLIDKDTLKVDEYLDRVLNLLGAAAENEKCRAAQKFIMVLTMLRTWYLAQKSDFGRCSNGGAAEDTAGAESNSGPCPGLCRDASETTTTSTLKRLGLADHLNNMLPAEQTSPSSSILARKVSGDPMEGVRTPGSIDGDTIHTPATTASRPDDKQSQSNFGAPPPLPTTPLHLLSNAAIEESASLSTVCGAAAAQNFTTAPGTGNANRATAPPQQPYSTPGKWLPSSSPVMYPSATAINGTPVVPGTPREDPLQQNMNQNVYASGGSSTSSMGREFQPLQGSMNGSVGLAMINGGMEMGFQGDLFVDDTFWALMDGNLNVFDWTSGV
ncbi:hypothetical protein RUND412_001525 [Rhizina undulata]